MSTFFNPWRRLRHLLDRSDRPPRQTDSPSRPSSVRSIDLAALQADLDRQWADTAGRYVGLLLQGHSHDPDGLERVLRIIAATGEPMAMFSLAVALRRNGQDEEGQVWMERAIASGDPKVAALVSELAARADGGTATEGRE
ncbi:hypothetical protein IU450_35800 [Nocardia abscessus]|uniref:hypothetical protein n=1 Tax=Nocardia abscessus TaxID=120957 RepID=UPI001894F4AE|nr:hypothetical protein [Nocardia abscessus]MBF6341206.1 hypothetical protein [Nocardia abscessus]